MSPTLRQRLPIIQWIAFLSIVRWYNILLLVVAQYIAAIFMLADSSSYLITLADYKLHFIIATSGILVAGGFLINNFYDYEKDIINRPKRTLFERLVSKSTLLKVYLLFNFVGLVLALMVSIRAFLFFLVFGVLLWFYSHKLKKLTLIGNLSASILAVYPFVSIFIYYRVDDFLAYLYTFSFWYLLFIREMVKDYEGIKGDYVVGYATLPVTMGKQPARRVIFWLTLMGLLLFLYTFSFITSPFVQLFLIIAILSFLSLISILFFDKELKFHKVFNNLLKVNIFLGIFAMMFF